MIWIHCGETDEVATTLSMAVRMREHVAGAHILITALPDDLALVSPIPSGIQVVSVPTDIPARIRGFLDHWRPSCMVWIGGVLRPGLLRLIGQAKIPATLINGRNAGIFPKGSGWIPRASRNAVAPFQTVLTADGATATRLIRGGVSRDIVKATGPILEDPIPLNHNQYELAVMAEALDTRPVWFAANVVETEIAHMAAAHLAASRKSHRLLLVLAPRDINQGAKAAATLREAGFRVGLRSDGDDPLAEHQAYIADLPDELGLWYRIAPLTFMGATMNGGGATSPYDPVLLGSAILHGTHKAPQEDRFARLAKAEACREVRSVAELGIAIGALISPEQSARMTLAGWEELTQNAESFNAVIKSCIDHLEAAQ